MVYKGSSRLHKETRFQQQQKRVAKKKIIKNTNKRKEMKGKEKRKGKGKIGKKEKQT